MPLLIPTTFRTEPDFVASPEIDFTQCRYGQAHPGEIAHVEVCGVVSEHGPMLRHRGRVVVDEVRKIIEVHVDRAHIPARSLELRGMTLAAAHIDQHGLSGRSARWNVESPLAGLRGLRQ